MARIVLVLVVLAAGSVVGAALFAHGSQAAPKEAAVAIQRTFVSTSGSDANPCTPTQPCRTFGAAIATTLAGGEVVALDSGGYGQFSIDKSITIAGAPGAHVAMTVFAAVGIGVDIAATDTVVLRNLHLTGLGGDAGIVFRGPGQLFLDSIVVSGFANQGLNAFGAGGELFVRDSVFRNNGNQGVVVQSPMRVDIADSRADRNSFGFVFFDGVHGSISGSAATRNSGNGFIFASGSVFTVSDSLADANGDGIGVFNNGTQTTLSGVVLSNNGSSGLFVEEGETPLARIGGSTVTGNGVGLLRQGGTLETFGDNLVRGNTTNTQGTITTVGKT